MRKRICCLLLLMTLILSGCVGRRTGQINYENTNSNVGIILEDLNADKCTCTVILYNNTDTDVGTGVDYLIQRQRNGKWQDVPFVTDDVAWTLPLFVAKSGSRCEYDADWTNYYGKLDKGQYRLIKEYYYLREDGMYDPNAPKNYAVFEFSVD